MSITPLPDFLKHGYADAGLPAPKPRPGTMRFPEQRPPPEPSGQGGAATAAWAVREWERLIAAGLLGGG